MRPRRPRNIRRRTSPLSDSSTRVLSLSYTPIDPPRRKNGSRLRHPGAGGLGRAAASRSGALAPLERAHRTQMPAQIARLDRPRRQLDHERRRRRERVVLPRGDRYREEPQTRRAESRQPGVAPRHSAIAPRRGGGGGGGGG